MFVCCLGAKLLPARVAVRGTGGHGSVAHTQQASPPRSGESADSAPCLLWCTAGAKCALVFLKSFVLY